MKRILKFITLFFLPLFGSVTSYLVDTNTPYANVITQSKGGVKTSYTYGNDLLNDNEHYFLADALGSTRALSDASGTITDTYSYTPYGELSNHTGSSQNNFLFAGEQFDSQTGEYYLRARYYSPSQARFISRDTYDGTLTNPITQNHYAYANANPMMYTDPSGRMSTMLELNNDIAIMGVLSTSTTYALFFGGTNGKGCFTQNAWLTVTLYNTQSWMQEEYISMIFHMAGKQTIQSPFGHEGEYEALNTSPNDPCKYIEKAIRILEAQIAWRYGDIVTGTEEAKGHYVRIKILQKQLDILKGAYNMWCKK